MGKKQTIKKPKTGNKFRYITKDKKHKSPFVFTKTEVEERVKAYIELASRTADDVVIEEETLTEYWICVYDPWLRSLMMLSDNQDKEQVRKYTRYYRNLYKTRTVKVFKSYEAYIEAWEEDQKKRSESIRRQEWQDGVFSLSVAK